MAKRGWNFGRMRCFIHSVADYSQVIRTYQLKVCSNMACLSQTCTELSVYRGASSIRLIPALQNVPQAFACDIERRRKTLDTARMRSTGK